jgi:DNA repair protein RecN (Recombination protein N)
MLKELHITNLVLIESATVLFAPGFNVLSGESGSGKSAIMNALTLIAGARCDSSVIRRGADKGVVEAVFDIDNSAHILPLLEKSGIDHEPGTELFIRREVGINGKSRAFINNQLAQLSLLRQVSESLFEMVSQHANQKLLSHDYHRQVIDMYGELEEQIAAFSECWEEEKRVGLELESLIQSEVKRVQEIQTCRLIIEELTEANIKEGEEEQLFADYSRLSNADALLAKVSELNRVLNGEKSNTLSLLSRQRTTLEQLIQMAPSLAGVAVSFESALLELQEVAHILHLFESQIEHNPEKISELNERLELINHVKRKYGISIQEINLYLLSTQKKLLLLENAEMHIEELREQVKVLSEKSFTLSRILTTRRQEIALKFQSEMILQLRSLNMPKVEFYVETTPQKRCRYGDDKIEFFIIPNVGEYKVSVKECASGGELSRTLLAIQTLLAGKDKIPSLIFDEIDGNIGGETAVVVGEKLQEISRNHQVLCITHFHQVAKQAKYHLRISKKEVGGRTISLVDLLNESNRHEELARMHGSTT